MAKIHPYQMSATGNDLASALKSFRSDKPVTAGMEMELFLLTTDRRLPDARTHDKFFIDLRKDIGDAVSVEPGAHMIEVKTDVHAAAAPLSADLLGVLGKVRHHAAAHGLIVQSGSDLPGFTTAQLAANLVSRKDPETGDIRRAAGMVDDCQKHGWSEISNWGCSTTSIHYTHSVGSADQLHRFSRVHAAMMPIYYAAFENREREGGVHGGLKLRRLLGQRGLVAPYVFSASDGEDFVDRYVDNVGKNQILTKLDQNGQYAGLSRPMTFNELAPRDRTAGNLWMAASAAWHCTKIKPVMDAAAAQRGNIALSHLLLEVRDLDVSKSAVPAIAGWLKTVTSSEDKLGEAEMRLESIGVPVCSKPRMAGERTIAALRAVENDPRTLETPFGNPMSGQTARVAVNEVILPMLAAAGNPAGALDLWKAVADSRTPFFPRWLAARRKARQQRRLISSGRQARRRQGLPAPAVTMITAPAHAQ